MVYFVLYYNMNAFFEMRSLFRSLCDSTHESLNFFDFVFNSWLVFGLQHLFVHAGTNYNRKLNSKIGLLFRGFHRSTC